MQDTKVIAKLVGIVFLTLTLGAPALAQQDPPTSAATGRSMPPTLITAK